jgi:hypothetical protein
MNEQLFQRYKNSSRIFHPERQGTDLGSLSTCKAELLELEGGEDGKIAQGRDLVLAKIPQLEQSLKDISASFELLKKQAKLEGRSISEMPTYMQEDFDRAEARLMVHRLESMKLRERINAFEVQKIEKPSDNKVLKYGPKGIGKLKEGILCELDGQRIELVDDQLIISDERSLFDGMRVSDYREYVIRPFKKELIRRQKLALECARKNEPIPKECKKMPEFRFWPEAVPSPTETKKGFKRKEKVS